MPAPSVADVSASLPAWATIGAEVEGSENSPGFEGAYASGELLEWLPHPTASEEAVMTAAATAAGCVKSSSPKGSKSPPKAAAITLASRPQGPWARVQSRTLVERSPYAPNGMLMTERCIPLERLRPRPLSATLVQP